MPPRAGTAVTWAVALVLAMTLAGCGQGLGDSGAGDGEGARPPEATTEPGSAAALHRLGLDAFARWDEGAMFRHMRAAWDAEPGFIPAIVDLDDYYTHGLRLPTRIRLALDSLALHEPRGDGLCAAFVLSRHEPVRGPDPAAAEDVDTGSHPCALFLRIRGPVPAGPDDRLALAEQLWLRFPDSPRLASVLLDLLTRERELDRLLGAADRMTRPERHPMLRAMGFAWRVNALAGADRWDDAIAARGEGDAFVREAGPGIRSAYLMELQRIHAAMILQRDDPRWHDRLDVMEAAEKELAALRARGGLYVAGLSRAAEATSLLDRGLLRESLRQWDGLVEAADTFTLEHQALIYMRRGRTRSKLGDLPAAEHDLIRARELAARAGDVERALEVEHNLLHVYEAMGRDERAREAGLAFVELTRIGPLEPVRMMACFDLGTFLRRRGEHDDARRMFEAMLAAVDSLDDYHHWAGQYHELTGDLDRAIAAYERSWRENQHDAARSLVALARLAEATGDGALAERYARAHDEALGPLFPEDAPILPGLLARAGAFDAAMAELEAAREAARTHGRTAALARLTLEAASILIERGDFEKAALLADTAWSAAGSVADVETAVTGRGLSALSRVHLGGPGLEDALAQLRRATDDAERSKHLQLRTDLFQMLGDALSELQRTEAALEAYARADALSDSAAAFLAHDLVRAGFRSERLRISNRALGAILREADHRDAPVRYAAWSLRRKARGIVDADQANTARELIRDVRSDLADDEALIDYVVLDRVSAALVLTRDTARVVLLPADARALATRVGTLLGRLQPRIGNAIDLSRASLDRVLAHHLYRDLLAPLEPALGARTRLIIVPDAPLHLLPFDALVRSGTGGVTEYAMDRYTLTGAPSLGSVVADHGPPDGPVLAVTAPGSTGLLAGEREIEAIDRAFFDREVIRLTRAAASEAAVREHAGTAAILHFAAHARASAGDPELAHLVLTGDDQDDGRLHAYEIRRLRLPGSLVILSACESAGGRVLRGEGPLSLSRAFLQAGARDVVGTLWPVGPATEPLMKEFYRSLAAGSPPAHALRSAKLRLRETHPDPFFWAAFVLVSRSS